jgi:hypothetical protein
MRKALSPTGGCRARVPRLQRPRHPSTLCSSVRRGGIAAAMTFKRRFRNLR